MMRKVNALELRQALGRVLDRLHKTGEPILIEKGRKPVAVLITLRDFQDRFHEKAAADERDRLIEEIERIGREAKVVDDTPLVQMIREMRGYED